MNLLRISTLYILLLICKEASDIEMSEKKKKKEKKRKTCKKWSKNGLKN